MKIEADIQADFKQLVEKSVKKYLHHAYIQTGCKEAAKDLVQDAFLTAYQKLSTFEKRSSLETWVFGILNNKILEYYRKNKGENIHVEFNAEEVLFHKNGKWKKEWLIDDEEKEGKEQENALVKFLKQCFSKMSEQYQRIFSLKFFAGKNTQEICKLCQCSADNVWQVLHRGKLQLKICIQSQLKKYRD
ncbi:MAG: RNA polymerase sigma factor [Bacteroidia bacterium]|nr:MAG: RNA polymerase sigma factor [Bacteroidia bacterium]